MYETKYSLACRTAPPFAMEDAEAPGGAPDASCSTIARGVISEDAMR